ncbi:MAG: hypothetical protein R3E66_17520 [bacterium]
MEDVKDAARRWAHDLEIDSENARLAAHQTTAEFHTRFEAGVPTLSLEDVSGIPFVSVIPGVEMYQHRARVRASDGDLFVASTPPMDGYEDYNRDVLHLGEPEFLLADPVDNPAASIQACMQGRAYAHVLNWTKAQPCVAIHPYMALESAWQLAAKLAHDSGVEVRVIGPTPAALWVANDKWALTQIIKEIAHERLVVESAASNDIETIAANLLTFAQRFESVGLKRTRCASAMGNLVFESDRIRHLSHADVLAQVRAFLERTEWAGDEEVIVVEWVNTDLSPSTQTWIPPVGTPRIDGVYEQLLEGREKVFVGSRPSTLPEPVNEALRHASLTVATAFQALGYVGRCSFDFVVAGDIHGDFQVKFTECNGRWGGTSTPMHLVDRVLGTNAQTRPHYIAQDFVHPSLVGATFHDIRNAIEDLLYRKDTGEGRFILYNTGPLTRSGKFDVISLGATPDEARDGVHNVLTRRLRL